VVKKSPCIHEGCDGSVRSPMVVCPRCGRCQTEKCVQTDLRIREWMEKESKKPKKPPKTRNQGFGGFTPPLK